MILPPGFRFHPTDVELVMYYLKRKVTGKKLLFEAITELNIYKFSPWDLPDNCCFKSKDLEWFFFCPTERKYASGARMNRATETGYWKTTGKDRPVHYNDNVVGMVRTLVFHQGSAPSGKRTDWVIHEYRIKEKSLADKGIAQDAYVLCKVFQKNGPGPKIGAQYGAPFQEEDWDDDSKFPVDSSSLDGPSPPVVELQKNQNSSAPLTKVDLGHSSGLCLSEPGPSMVRPSLDVMLLDGQNGSILTSMVDQANISGGPSKAGVSLASHSAHDMNVELQNDDEIAYLLDSFQEDEPLLLTGDANNEVAHSYQGREIQTVPNSNGSDPFSGLEDLNDLVRLDGSRLHFSDMEFLELDDLNAPLNFPAESYGIGVIQSSGLHRACNFSSSQHILPESFCRGYNPYYDLSEFQHQGNLPGYEPCLTDLPLLHNVVDASDKQWNSAAVMPMGNIYPSTYPPPYGLNLTSDAAKGIQNFNEAGKRRSSSYNVTCGISDEVVKTSYLGSVGAAGAKQ